nr:hypothetical protein [Corynebacterium diphtheriae]
MRSQTSRSRTFPQWLATS